MSHHELIIIGTGPAGLTSAIYAGRDNIDTLVIEGNQPGGQLTITSEVENFPGFPEGIGGSELMERFRRQAEKFGAKFITAEVTKVDLKNKPFTLWLDDKKLTCNAMIISTGASARWLGIESEEKLRGKGVSACATCDGFFFKNKEVAVVGGGDAAAEEALYLTKFVKKVTLIHRRDQLRATPIMKKRLEENPKIDFAWNSTVLEIKDVSADKVTGVVIKNVKTGDVKTLACEGVFVAIGHKPNTEIFKGQLEMDDAGYIKTDDVKTTVIGVFAAGDCQDTKYWQAITAAGSGCQAALEVRKYLQENV